MRSPRVADVVCQVVTGRKLLDPFEKSVADIFANNTKKKPVQQVPVGRSSLTYFQKLTNFRSKIETVALLCEIEGFPQTCPANRRNGCGTYQKSQMTTCH